MPNSLHNGTEMDKIPWRGGDEGEKTAEEMGLEEALIIE